MIKVLEFIYKIYMYITCVFWYFIICPIKRFWNTYVRNVYIPDNIRNQQSYEYCLKICDNPDYQPSNPIEHWFEGQLENLYKEIREEAIACHELVGDYDTEFQKFRLSAAMQVVCEIQEYSIRKDR